MLSGSDSDSDPILDIELYSGRTVTDVELHFMNKY